MAAVTLSDKDAALLDELLAQVEAGKARSAKARRLARAARDAFRADADRRARRGRPAPVYQLPLAFIADAPAKGAIRENDLVQCDRYACRLLLRVCLQRQDAKWPGGNRKKDGSVVAKKAGIYEFCASGTCAQGVEYRKRSGYDAGEAWAAGSKRGSAAYQFFRKDVGDQRKKRRTHIRSNLDMVPDLDHPPGQPERVQVEPDDAEDVREILRGGG